MSAACRGKQTQCRLPTKRSFVSSPLSHEKRQPFRIVFFGADNRTCSERSERNSGTGEFIRGSEAPAAQRAGAHGVCRQCPALSQVLLQTKDMKKRTELTVRFILVWCGQQDLNLHSLATIRT